MEEYGALRAKPFSMGRATTRLIDPSPTPPPSPFDPSSSPRMQPSLVRHVLFSFQGPAKSYLRLHLAAWIVATALLVADRLLWNLWSRQSVFSSVGNGFCEEGACGTDYFCAVDEVRLVAAVGTEALSGEARSKRAREKKPR